MSLRKIMGTTLLLFVFFSLGYALYTVIYENMHVGENIKDLESLGEGKDNVVYVFYLHGNAKCITCRGILKATQTVLQSSYRNILDTGKLVYTEINVDLPKNKAYGEKFHYFSTSVIVALYQKGILKNWKNLDKVWDFSKNLETFTPYFTKEVDAMLKEGGIIP